MRQTSCGVIAPNIPASPVSSTPVGTRVWVRGSGGLAYLTASRGFMRDRSHCCGSCRGEGLDAGIAVVQLTRDSRGAWQAALDGGARHDRAERNV
jgi:hypothetical protein